jgi:hypothetical protein
LYKSRFVFPCYSAERAKREEKGDFPLLAGAGPDPCLFSSLRRREEGGILVPVSRRVDSRGSRSAGDVEEVAALSKGIKLLQLRPPCAGVLRSHGAVSAAFGAPGSVDLWRVCSSRADGAATPAYALVSFLYLDAGVPSATTSVSGEVLVLWPCCRLVVASSCGDAGVLSWCVGGCGGSSLLLLSGGSGDWEEVLLLRSTSSSCERAIAEDDVPPSARTRLLIQGQAAAMVGGGAGATPQPRPVSELVVTGAFRDPDVISGFLMCFVTLSSLI